MINNNNLNTSTNMLVNLLANPEKINNNIAIDNNNNANNNSFINNNKINDNENINNINNNENINLNENNLYEKSLSNKSKKASIKSLKSKKSNDFDKIIKNDFEKNININDKFINNAFDNEHEISKELDINIDDLKKESCMPDIPKKINATLFNEKINATLFNEKINSNMFDQNELKIKKLEMLNKLSELARRGHIISTNYDLNSDYNMMKYEYDLILKIKSKQAGIKWMNNVTLNIIGGLEFLNEKYNPFDLHLTGWSEVMRSDIDDYHDVFSELYDKYHSDKSFPPEIKLLLMITFSAIKFNVAHSTFNVLPNLQNMLSNLQKNNNNNNNNANNNANNNFNNNNTNNNFNNNNANNNFNNNNKNNLNNNNVNNNNDINNKMKKMYEDASKKMQSLQNINKFEKLNDISLQELNVPKNLNEILKKVNNNITKEEKNEVNIEENVEENKKMEELSMEKNEINIDSISIGNGNGNGNENEKQKKKRTKKNQK
jgi:hypothetical protein